MHTFSQKNHIVHDKYNKHYLSYNHKKSVLELVTRTLTNGCQVASSISHNASTVSATMINLYGPGVRVMHTFQTVSNSIVHDNLSTTVL